MVKLKKTSKTSGKKEDPKKIRRNQILVPVIVVGAIIIVLAGIFAYLEVSDRWTRSAALENIQSDDEAARIEGVRSIGLHRMDEYTGRLCTMLENDPSVKVRKMIPANLARLDHSKAVPALVNALGAFSDNIAATAMEALQKAAETDVTWANVIEWWRANKDRYGAATYGPDGTPVVHGMNEMMESEKYYDRWAAVKRLDKLDHPATRPVLEDAADDPHEKVREAAEQALSDLPASAAQSQ